MFWNRLLNLQLKSPSADEKVKSTDLKDKKDKSESKNYSPFDEDES